MVADNVQLRCALRHILWLGGAPDAGKTSIARLLAERHHLQVYHLDAAEAGHVARLDPTRHPAMRGWAAMTTDERWVLRPPEAIAQHTVAFGVERFALVIEDLLALPKAPPILAEGPWLFPDLVAPLLSSPRQALWLNPTEVFKRASAARRGKPSSRGEASDPERMVRHWFVRDLMLAAYIGRRATERGLTLIEVDGVKSLDAMAAVVEAHFALPLSATPCVGDRWAVPSSAAARHRQVEE